MRVLRLLLCDLRQLLPRLLFRPLRPRLLLPRPLLRQHLSLRQHLRLRHRQRPRFAAWSCRRRVHVPPTRRLLVQPTRHAVPSLSGLVQAAVLPALAIRVLVALDPVRRWAVREDPAVPVVLAAPVDLEHAGPCTPHVPSPVVPVEGPVALVALAVAPALAHAPASVHALVWADVPAWVDPAVSCRLLRERPQQTGPYATLAVPVAVRRAMRRTRK